MLFTGTEAFGSAPESDEIEVSVIGPGYGEAILVHTGDGRWICVDSCICGPDSTPAPLRYLEAINVDPRQVFLIVASHWDDDHIRGMHALLEACKSADFATSKSLGSSEFLAFAEAFDRPLTNFSRPGAREVTKAFKHCIDNNVAPKSASPNRRLFSPSDYKYTHGLPVEVWTLSPSDFEFDNFLKWILDQMPHDGETKRLATPRIRNDLSVVVQISFGDDAILLGGDLEEEGRPDTGWSAIILGQGNPAQTASVFKVAHHGSVTGHHDGIWSSLLNKDPVAIVSPFKRGRVSLPTQNDVSRISEISGSSFSTINLRNRSPIRRSAIVEKGMRETVKEFYAIPQIPGMVRLRKNLRTSPNWTVEMFGDSCELKDIYK